jgi:hypothetical protein
MIEPCYQCKDRYPACHDKCNKYKEFKKEKERVRNNRQSFKFIPNKRRKNM